MTNPQPQPDTPLIDADGAPFDVGDYVVVDGDAEGLVTTRLLGGNVIVEFDGGFIPPIEVDPADVALSRLDA